MTSASILVRFPFRQSDPTSGIGNRGRRAGGVSPLFLSPCFYPPVSISLFLSPCFYLPVSISLFLSPCFYPPVSISLFLSPCFYLPVSISLFLSPCFYLPVSPVSIDACRWLVFADWSFYPRFLAFVVIISDFRFIVFTHNRRRAGLGLGPWYPWGLRETGCRRAIAPQ